jgi:diguanylate cyclase (GGDEF)-like protein
VTLKNRIITALVLLGWISVWLVLIIAYRIVQPIAKLSQASKDIISFSYGEPLDFKRSNDEVGVLASNFEIMRQKIRELISIDPLTNVHNRRYLMHALEMAVEKAVRTGEDLSCVMIDIDHFKQINDRYGHLGGDQVLACLGGLLQANVRMYDIVARFGGEEFALVLPGVPLTEAFETAERIRLIVDGAAVEFKDHQIHFTISAGVSTIKELPVKTSDSLVDCADSALYKAKGAGRNKTARYTPDML